MSSRTDESLIARLRDLPEMERVEYLERACISDPTLRDRLPAILGTISFAGPQVNQQPKPATTINLSKPNHSGMIQAFESALECDEPETSGTQIAHYKLLQEIGEGGFGVVWMAEQLAPIRRRVALKIIKLGMDTKEVIARFEAERQALALMDHPNIAHVFDAGATDAGRPYFAMELVRGVAITRYCDENRLSPEARLRLFITVCQAVQHAHQKGVIHRDLKPSNILVTMHDGVPVPKVIDFGIAKATSAHLTDKTLFTQFHAFIGTPAYTSPEQMEMSGLDVDTRSDIYSLGVLLYELLTGQPPFDSDALMKSGLEAMRRTIREIDPPRPSTRLRTLSAVNRTSIAHQRNTDAGKLSLLLRGDLDWIAMRCLEKDRTRRYDSAAGLAADLARHLANEPVAARPPSRLYQARKFIRRHRLAVAAVAAVTASLIAGLIASSALFVRERSAHHRAALAEQRETDLRQQAEIARAAEVKRAARTALDLANRNLTDGRVADGLAYLVYAARKDPLNAVLAPRLASVLASNNFILPEGPPFECGSRVVALRYALDGRTFLAGTEDGTLRVFEAATGKLLREFRLGKIVLIEGGWLFPRAGDEFFAARFSDNIFAVFDATTGRQRGTAIPFDPSVLPTAERVRLSPDGRWVCASSPETCWLWDTQTGEKKFERHIERGLVQDYDFSADGRLFCMVGNDEVGIWSLPGLARAIEPLTVERRLLQQKHRSQLFVRFLPDSRRLAIIDPFSGIRICDFTAGSGLGPLIANEGGFYRQTWEFSPDGRLLQGGENFGLRDLTTGKLTPLPLPSRGENWEKYFSRDGALVLTTSNDESAHLWETKTGKSAAQFSLQLQTSIRGALHPDGTQIVVGTAQGSIHRLRVGRGIARPLVLPRTQPAMPLVFLAQPPARLFWFTADRARVLEVASGRETSGGFVFPRKLTENSPGEGYAKSAVRADLKFFVVRNGSAWEAWEFSPNGVSHVVPLRDSPPPTRGIVTFSPAGDGVAITDGTKIGVWNLRTGARIGPGIDGHQPLWWIGVNFSPDGRRLGAPFLGAPSIWDVASATPVTGTFTPAPEQPLIAAEFSPDGTRLLTADRNGNARLWNSVTGTPLGPTLSHADILSSALFSPDGCYFITRTYSELRVWNTQTSSLVGEPIPLGVGRDFRFTVDSRRFITASEDGSARVFDVRTAQPYTEPMNHDGARLPSVYFSPDGLFVRVETTAPDFRIWSVPPSLGEGTPPPEWLLQLATACAGKAVNDQGQLTAITDNAARIETVRAQLAALPADARLADWGRWILNDRADRPIAPGFTISPADADALVARNKAVEAATP